jgi:spermidine/putrescine transport system substrate-binding protein
MTIPITAANPVDALMAMDFFYGVEIAATLAEYIN